MMPRRSLPPQVRARGVTAVLGPTNTGKTHLAIERMLGHASGMIGLPLRLLAREVYNRVVERAGADAVALVTGEEKIKPPGARYWIATVEAMPRDVSVDFVAIDEIQLAADMDRGHVFTDRLLNQRGASETLVIGAATMKPLVEALLPGAHIVSRPRLSRLSFAGEKKITRLPRRSAIVAFSADEVYAIAELVRRQKGGAAVVLGALSPRTRNAQVALYQNGDVDYLIATDAIGMGLNLDVEHVAFAADRKFDGLKYRHLTPGEMGQIAGRAGRYLTDGTFGTTGRCPPLDADIVERLEEHAFEPIRMLQWRNPDLDFSSVAALQASLARTPAEPGLTRAPLADDELSLEAALKDDDIRHLARGLSAVERLWEVAQVPDYRKVAPAAHADLVATLYRFLMKGGRIPEDWFARQIGHVDRIDGDIDTLSARIAQVRTWTFVANRGDWLADPEHWQGVARQVEDNLSDALHEKLAQRFVDRRTSVLMRRLRENGMLEAEIQATGDVLVAGQHVGTLHGFQFAPDIRGDSAEDRALRAAAAKALAGEIEKRADRLAEAGDDSFVLSTDGTLRWNGEAIGKLVAGDKTLAPRVRLLADEQLTGAARDKVENRASAWVAARIGKLLGPLLVLENPPDLTGVARGIAFQIAEALGVLDRARVADEVKGLDQTARAALRAHGVRFGAYHLYLPALLKPAPRALACQLHALKHGEPGMKGLDELPSLAASGRTSIAVDEEIDKGLYRAAGFRVCGNRAIRVDILERLADLIRPAIQYRPGTTPGEPPPGAADNDGFVVTVAMTSLAGCAGEDFAAILKSLGYVLERRPGPAITRAIVPLAPAAPLAEAKGAEPAAVPGDGGEAAEAPAATGAEAAQEPDAAIDASGETPGETVSSDAPATEASTPAAGSPADAEAADMGAAETSPDDAPTAAPVEAQAAEAVAAGDAPATDDAPAEATSSDSAPAEPELIEVWRPHRRNHHASGRPQHRRDDRQPRRDGGQRRPGQDRAGQDRSGQDRPAQGEGGQARGAGDRPRRQDGGPQRQGRPGGERRPEGERPRDGRPDRQSRGAPRPDRRERDGRAERPFFQDQKPKADRQPDPNSPFAKLLALKQQLENKDDGKR